MPDEEFEEAPGTSAAWSVVVHAVIALLLSGLFLLAAVYLVTRLSQLEDFALHCIASAYNFVVGAFEHDVGR